MVGQRCGIYTPDKGKINCQGRVILNDDVMLYSRGLLDLGGGLGVNKFSRIVAHEKIEIGKNVTIGQMVSILDHDHDYSMESGELHLAGYVSSPIKIGSNVWIADKVTILKGITIGDNVIVGANTLVNKDVPANSVIAGNPFRIIKSLD